MDSHYHIWRYNEVEYPWIPSSDAGQKLKKDYLPHNLAVEQQLVGHEGGIAVQARQCTAESTFLLDSADAYPAVKGVVGWVDLQSPTVLTDLARLSRHPKFVGVRHVIHDEPNAVDFMQRPSFRAGLAHLASLGLSYDLLLFPEHLPHALELARAFPTTNFILDHAGNPDIKSGMTEPWATHLAQLAECPNLWCKVSGLLTRADHATWTVQQLTPYLDIIFSCFGPARCMFGSDWPVCTLAGSYEASVQALRTYIVTNGMWTPEDEAAFWSGSCRAAYALSDRQANATCA